jgi:hypothetical protein
MEVRSSNVLKRHFSEARVTHDPRWATSVKIGYIFEPDNNFDSQFNLFIKDSCQVLIFHIESSRAIFLLFQKCYYIFRGNDPIIEYVRNMEQIFMRIAF